MKDLCQYGNRPEDEWEILPWIPDPRPPFKIWVKPEQIAPFFGLFSLFFLPFLLIFTQMFFLVRLSLQQ